MQSRAQIPCLAGLLLPMVLAEPTAKANDPHCEGPSDPVSVCQSDPGPDDIIVYADHNFGGKCKKFSAAPPSAAQVQVPSLSAYGFNDCISSVKVGSQVRLRAYQNDWYNLSHFGTPFGVGYFTYNSSWHMATYEPGFVAQTVNDDFSSLTFDRIDCSNRGENRERIPNNLVGSFPDGSDTTSWDMEAQGLCHNKTHWFIAEEQAALPTYGYTYSPNYSCLFDSGGQGLTGTIWKWPREKSLSGTEPGVPVLGATWKFLWQMQGVPNVNQGYRHFGDPDCLTVNGKDYVFVPVQACTSNDKSTLNLPYVLVLDSDLNAVAALTLPAISPTDIAYESLRTCLQPNTPAVYGLNDPRDVRNHGMGSWVAVKQGSAGPTSVEVWMSTDICGGQGMRIFTADLSSASAANPANIALQDRAAGPLITNLSEPEYFGSVQGGVFSPTGNTLYLLTGDTSHYGGIRVIDPNSGLELTESGNNYGPFNFAHTLHYACVPGWIPVFGGDCIPTGEEPEGLDFLDTRCTDGSPVDPEIPSSQLHAILLHNGVDDLGDRVEVRHYSVSSGAPLMCDSGGSICGSGGAGGTGGTGGSGGAGGTSGTGSIGGAGGTSGTGGIGGAGGAGQGSPGWACLRECITETQSDLKMCQAYLNCYGVNNCGPSTCGSQDQVCGVNKIGWGTAPKQIADAAYNCLAQSGDGLGQQTGTSACLQNWPATSCGQLCTGQTQSDRQTCQAYLDCYYMNACGPSSSCASQDAVCGVNRLLGGTAGQSIANQVYQCLSCP